MPPANPLLTRNALSTGDLVGICFPSGRYSNRENHQWDPALNYPARYRKKSQTRQVIINAGIMALRRQHGFV
ncbi:MAG: hypothetical protein WB586_07475 [Chthoniobacterales bacterium]